MRTPRARARTRSMMLRAATAELSGRSLQGRPPFCLPPVSLWAAARTPAALHTPAGEPFVTLQIAGVRALAVPLTALATGLVGSLSAAATCSWVTPARIGGEKDAPDST